MWTAVDNSSSQRGTATGATSPLSDPHASNLWTQAVEALRGIMPRQAFDTWIRGLKLVAIEEETIRLLAPSRYVIEWVQDTFAESNTLYASLWEIDSSRNIKHSYGDAHTLVIPYRGVTSPSN